MANLTVRNVPEEVHRALRVRAAEHGRSTEAEVRAILADSVKPPERIRMGDALAALGRRMELTEAECTTIQRHRDAVPAEPMSFE